MKTKDIAIISVLFFIGIAVIIYRYYVKNNAANWEKNNNVGLTAGDDNYKNNPNREVLPIGTVLQNSITWERKTVGNMYADQVVYPWFINNYK